MLSKELQLSILSEIDKYCVKEILEDKLYEECDASVEVSYKFKKASKSTPKSKRASVCCEACSAPEPIEIPISTNRVVEDDNDLEGLSSIANGPCKSLDEILEIVKNDLNEVSDLTFSEYLLHIIDKKNLKDSIVYKKAGVSKQLFSIIRSDKYYVPKKKTAFALVLALELDLDTAKDLLGKGGYTFGKSPTDIAVEMLIKNNIYSVVDANIFLQELIDKGYKAELLGY